MNLKYLAGATVFIATFLSAEFVGTLIVQEKSKQRETQEARVQFPLIPLKVGAQSIKTQWAHTDAQRMRGLMRQEPPLKYGMLLEFRTPQIIGLWMKNTPAPLDVAFIGPDWRIIGFASMKPYSEETHTSPGQAIAALEMPLGWFSEHSIVIGDLVEYCHPANADCLSNKKLAVR